MYLNENEIIDKTKKKLKEYYNDKRLDKTKEHLKKNWKKYALGAALVAAPEIAGATISKIGEKTNSVGTMKTGTYMRPYYWANRAFRGSDEEMAKKALSDGVNNAKEDAKKKVANVLDQIR